MPRIIKGHTAEFEPEFDTAYQIDRDGNIYSPDGWHYVPAVEHDDRHDILIDGIPTRAKAEGDDHSEWDALTGYTGQYGYRGAVMHAAERWGSWARKALADLADDDTIPGIEFAVVEVSGHNDSDPVFPDEPGYCEEFGCAHEPAGWAVIYRPAESN